jgi:threonyl-tRNA synthetase|tara:strand:- start:891 stop:1235 length:345 start_codon:yes stop_codon:yes gene_type:complete
MQEHIKPRFEVHKLEGTAMKTIAKPKTDKKGTLLGGFDYEEVEVDAGWMVYFPNGSSIRVWTEEEMERQGFLNDPHLVNMETGDDMGAASHTSLKSRSEQKEIVTKSSKVHHVT